jgi:predicted amidohydrolase
MNVTVLQMKIDDGAAAANLRCATALLEAAAGSDLYLLPELWSSGYVQERWREIAASETPQVMDGLACLARKHHCWIGGSVIWQCDDGALVNRFLLLDRQGSIAATYDKVHLFRPMREHEFLKAGKAVPILDVEGIRIAPAICYDLRFPGMFGHAAERGVDLFLVPSEWPRPRCLPLRILARARAVENQCYLALCNRIGPSADGAEFCGGSVIIDPLGNEAAVADTEGAATMSIDTLLLMQTRNFLRVFQERVPGVDTPQA